MLILIDLILIWSLPFASSQVPIPSRFQMPGCSMFLAWTKSSFSPLGFFLGLSDWSLTFIPLYITMFMINTDVFTISSTDIRKVSQFLYGFIQRSFRGYDEFLFFRSIFFEKYTRRFIFIIASIFSIWGKTYERVFYRRSNCPPKSNFFNRWFFSLFDRVEPIFFLFRPRRSDFIDRAR